MQLYDVLVFGAQYRLGTFGFLALEELREEHTEQYAGNYGLFDQQGLLQWIANNYRAFGGLAKVWSSGVGGRMERSRSVATWSRGLAEVCMLGPSCRAQGAHGTRSRRKG